MNSLGPKNNCDQCSQSFFQDDLRPGKCKHLFCTPCIWEIADKAINVNATACYACERTFKQLPKSNDLSFVEISDQKIQIKSDKGIEPSNSLPEDLISLIERWKNNEYSNPDLFQNEFHGLLEKIVKLFFEKQLSADNIKELHTSLEDFKKELSPYSSLEKSKKNMYDFINLPYVLTTKEGEPLSTVYVQTLARSEVKIALPGLDKPHWEYLNFVLNRLSTNVPAQVLNHCSFHPDFKSNPQEIRDDAERVVKDAYEDDPSKIFYMLRSTTRARGTDSLKKFTITCCLNGKICSSRAGFKPETNEWIPIGLNQDSEEEIGDSYNGNPNLEGFIHQLIANKASFYGCNLKPITPVIWATNSYEPLLPKIFRL